MRSYGYEKFFCALPNRSPRRSSVRISVRLSRCTLRFINLVRPESGANLSRSACADWPKYCRSLDALPQSRQKFDFRILFAQRRLFRSTLRPALTFKCADYNEISLMWPVISSRQPGSIKRRQSADSTGRKSPGTSFGRSSNRDSRIERTTFRPPSWYGLSVTRIEQRLPVLNADLCAFNLLTAKVPT